jgi:hypothetical protein
MTKGDVCGVLTFAVRPVSYTNERFTDSQPIPVPSDARQHASALNPRSRPQAATTNQYGLLNARDAS